LFECLKIKVTYYKRNLFFKIKNIISNLKINGNMNSFILFF
jgi:hypothetical protein